MGIPRPLNHPLRRYPLVPALSGPSEPPSPSRPGCPATHPATPSGRPTPAPLSPGLIDCALWRSARVAATERWNLHNFCLNNLSLPFLYEANNIAASSLPVAFHCPIPARLPNSRVSTSMLASVDLLNHKVRLGTSGDEHSFEVFVVLVGRNIKEKICSL